LQQKVDHQGWHHLSKVQQVAQEARRREFREKVKMMKRSFVGKSLEPRELLDNSWWEGNLSKVFLW